MKKLLIVIVVFFLFSFTIEKLISLKFTESQIKFHWKNLENTKKLIDESNLPHAQAKFIIATIDSLQKDITKNAKIDSVSSTFLNKK